ncbi:MAG: hypothetical protein HFP77_01810 [Methylococcales symbiont of Iophon sp. n. MRB-2018]|nr:MAG: hypothetical protein HFP77_01810 [Methylococcales symbiont of Iophon sp. n. MRB-2018]KAF3980530.1 MAG: hypothetical protein HFP76_01675 [Methylococcales symbiont of Iophon sp. n. MRB-2018]
MNEINIRINQIMALLAKEDILLSDVCQRLFNQQTLDESWLKNILEKPEGLDKLESFGSKFCRMQDTFIDKLTPLFLIKLGEISSSAINNLNKLERLNIVDNVNDWLDMRLLRNKLVHEYVDDITELLTHLLLAKKSYRQLHNSYLKAKTVLNENQ